MESDDPRTVAEATDDAVGLAGAEEDVGEDVEVSITGSVTASSTRSRTLKSTMS